jgi:hypothetical protein
MPTLNALTRDRYTLIPLARAGALLNPEKPYSVGHMRRLIRLGELQSTRVGDFHFLTPQAISGFRRRRAS